MMTEISCNYAIATLRTITQKQYVCHSLLIVNEHVSMYM